MLLKYTADEKEKEAIVRKIRELKMVLTILAIALASILSEIAFLNNLPLHPPQSLTRCLYRLQIQIPNLECNCFL